MAEVLAPGDHLGSANQSQLNRRSDARKRHELFEIIAVGPASVWVVDVREPLGSRRNSFKLGEFRGGGSCVYRPKFLDLVISIQI